MRGEMSLKIVMQGLQSVNWTKFLLTKLTIISRGQTSRCRGALLEYA
jgi:hypothetical protein